MASLEKFVPFVIKWEAGVAQQQGESCEALFARARKRGWSDDPNDLGGATQTGVTLGTYAQWCRKHRKDAPKKDDLKRIPYATWYDIIKTMYWDRWKADNIQSQGVANILVDWVWCSGRHGIVKPQKLLRVVADGIVGAKTLAALNGKSPLPFFMTLKQARIDFVEGIVDNAPSQKVFLKGWKNRINDLKYC